MELHPVDVIISFVNIVVLFLLLRLILWKHINRFLSSRASRIREEIADASKIRQDAESLKSEYDQKIRELEERGAEILHESQVKATAESDRILEEAKAVIHEKMREADARIEINKAQAIRDAHEDITQLATEMASRILMREVSSADSTRMVDDFFRDS